MGVKLSVRRTMKRKDGKSKGTISSSKTLNTYSEYDKNGNKTTKSVYAYSKSIIQKVGYD